MAIQFSYSHFGTSTPVRTHPIWVTPNTESRLDGATATYEFIQMRSNLKSILLSHPLKVSAVSRSSMGSDIVGDAIVDLSVLFAQSPFMYRCPVTKKSFKERGQYVEFRQTMLALKAAGRIDRAPPAEPILIRTIDAYLPLLNGPQMAPQDGAYGGRLRVVVVLEEMSEVGGETGVRVQQGYKQHNGGVYQQDQEGSSSSSDFHDFGVGQELTESSKISLGLSQDRSQAERAHLERLTNEWETWRRQAEEKWKDELREKEGALRRQLESEVAASLAGRSDDLRRAHEENGRLEVRLRTAIGERTR